MDDPELKIQTFRPTWEEFKDFSKYIKFIESKGAHKAGLARIIPPKEYVPRKQRYDDLTKFGVTIKKPICQAVANVEGAYQGAYQQVNVPLKSMTVTDFKDLARTPQYATPSHKDYKHIERLFWENITNHAGIYGADVCGTITDPELEHWNINKLGTILDYVGEDYNMTIDGVNTAYLYFGMWKTTFAWHTEDMDLYSINYLHFGAPKTWYAVPPSYGRKFEKLAASVFPKSAAVCRAFLRHKMTILHLNYLKDYDIPYDTVTQEAGQFMITFPFGYHSGFNHGFNCAESTNFAIERWVEYGKHASICYCCPDAVRISMDVYVKRFQPSIFEAWKEGNDRTPHPEYNSNYHEPNQPVPNKKMSFKERNPDLNIENILLNPNIPVHVKLELRGSFLVSVDEEVAGLMADLDETNRKTALQRFYDDSSDEDERPGKRRRKKHDSDYDDDWYVTKGHKYISEDGKVEKKVGVGRLARGRQATVRKTLSPKVRVTTIEPGSNVKRGRKKRESAPAGIAGDSKLTDDELTGRVVGAKLTVIQTKEKKVTVMSAKPSSLPTHLLTPTKLESIAVPPKPNGPSFNNVFTQFLMMSQESKDNSAETSQEVPSPKVTPVKQICVPVKVIVQPIKQSPPQVKLLVQQKTPPMSTKVTSVQLQQEAWTNRILEQTQDQQKLSQQRVKTERIEPYVSGQSTIYTNSLATENGKQLFCTIVSSTNSSPQRQVKVNRQTFEKKQQYF